MKWTLFRKRIDPCHINRDYDNPFTSSKGDVLTTTYTDITYDSTKLQRKATRKSITSNSARPRGSIAHTFERQKTLEPDSWKEDLKKPGKANFFVHNKHVAYCKTSLHFLTEQSKIRYGCVWFTEWKYTEFIIISIVIFNSVILGLMDYGDGQENVINRLVKIIGPIFYCAICGRGFN